MKIDPRIVVEERHGHWNAWFDDRPQETFGGDTPGTAVERLWEAELNNREARNSAGRIVRPKSDEIG
jgi:hypothetical protein